jgi:hypothetical protein
MSITDCPAQIGTVDQSDSLSVKLDPWLGQPGLEGIISLVLSDERSALWSAVLARLVLSVSALAVLVHGCRAARCPAVAVPGRSVGG